MKSKSLHRIRELLEVLDRTTGDPGDLTGTLQHIAQTAQTFFAADDCVILAINPISGRFIASLTIAGDLPEEQVSFEQPRPEGNAQEILKRSVLLIEDLQVTPERHSTFTRLEGIRSFAGLALQTNYSRKPLGVLYLDFRQPQQFSFDDQELFQLFADQASYILQETWLLQRYQEVARIGREINHELSTADNLFQKLQEHVADILDASYALLLAVYQPQTNTLDLYIEEEGRSTIRNNDPLEGACQYVIETLKPLFIRQISKEVATLPFQPVEIITEARSKESLIFVPLVLRDVPLGVLSIQHLQPNAYNQEDLFILQLLANHIALALHNVRLYSSLTQLNETGQLLTQQLESEQTLQATVDKIRDATKADVVVLYPYEPTRQCFVLPPRIAGTLYSSLPQSMSPSRSNDIAAVALRHVESIFAKESTTIYTMLHGDVRIRQENFQHREKIRSTAVVPLQVGDESVGVLFINFRQPQYFDAPQKKLIDGLAHYAAIAIKNAQEYGSLIQRRVRELEILQNIDRELDRTLDLESTLHTLLRLAFEQVDAEEASILLRNSRTQVLEIPAAIGPNAEERRKHIISLQEARGITRWAWEHKKPARVDNVHSDPQWRDLYIQSAADTVSELDVPLLDGEDVIGIINFESTRGNAFRQEDEDFLITLAGQAVLAIENAQAYEREKRLAEEGRVLNQISKEIISHLDPYLIFDLILKKALELTHSHMGNLMLYDPDHNDLWMAAEHGVTEDKKGYRQRLDEGVVGYAARSKQSLNVDLSQSPWNEIYLEFFPGARSELAAPMLAGDELRGVLNVESPFPDNFNESDERLLQGLADLAVVALQNAQAYEREKRLAQESQVLNEISKEIISQLDHVRVFNLILDKALELTHSTLGSLHLYDAEPDELRMMVERGVAEEKKGLRQKLGKGIVGYVAGRKQLLNVEDVTQPPWKEIYVEFFPGARSELAVPMLEGNELRGVLNIESPTSNNFTDRDERLLQGLADLAVVALQNAERYEKAEKEAQRFELLYRAGQELGKITEWTQLEQAYDAILHIAEEHSQSLVVIRRYDEETQELVVIRASESQYASLFRPKNLDIGINGQVAREKRTIVIHDTNDPPPDVVAVQLSDPTTRSLFITPIMFKDRYYGNLALRHQKVGHFQGTDKQFFEGLAQQLASTIYRLETAQARQEFEQRASAAEVMSSIGQAAFELTHRWGNDLGLVPSYVNDIRSEFKTLSVNDMFISEKLENIVRDVRKVLDLSEGLKHDLLQSGEAMASEPVIIHPGMLLEEAHNVPSLPPTIQMGVEIDPDVTAVRVMPGLVADILRNLVTNAVEAMPAGGKIILRARNAGRVVALEVSDTGPGIPQQKLSKIFDLFYSTKGSTGFGLWSARRNALSNHGELTVKSEVGKGTTFTLLLPKVEEATS